MRRLPVVLPFLLVTAACGASVSDPPDSAPLPPDAARPDATPFPDSGPQVDAADLAVTLYAHSRDTLYTVDPVSFDVTTVGLFNTVGGDLMTDLAVTPDGTIYGISQTKLYRIDAPSGQAIFVANVAGVSNVALTFLPDGTLLASDASGGVRSINPTTGAVNEIGAFGGGYATAGDLVAVADGTMYAISDQGLPDAFDRNILLTVNPVTGAGSFVGQMDYGRTFGAAYANGRVYAFTSMGQIIEVDPTNGDSTLVRSHALEFWGAAVTPLVPPIP